MTFLLGALALICMSVVPEYITAQKVCVADIAFVVDESGSIRDTNPRGTPNGSPEDNWEKQRSFMKTVISGSSSSEGLEIAPDQTRVAMVTFSNNAKLHWDFNEYTDNDELEDAVSNLPYRGGNTNTTGGLIVANTEVFVEEGGDRPDADNLMILLSDGTPTRMIEELVPYAEMMRDQNNIRIIGIGVTSAVNVTTFRQIVSSPFEDHYFSVENFDELQGIIGDLIEEACRTLAPRPPRTTTPLPAGPCRNEADLNFVIDASGSIRQRNFETVRQFIMGITNELDIDTGRVQMGLIKFSDRAEIEFDYSEYDRRSDIIDHVSTMEYTRGRTNTADALRMLRETAFANRDNRRDVPDIALLFTDGNSMDIEETIREAYLCKQAGIHIIVVAVSDWINTDELDTVASYPSTVNRFLLDSYDRLNDIVEEIRDLICNNNDNCRRNTCDNGGTCIDGVEYFWCLCPEGFAGRTCETTCREPADVGFALDMSGSIRLPNFRKEVDFVREVVYQLNMPQHQVSLTTFGNEAQVRFPLDQFSTHQQIMDPLGTLNYARRETTNTADALQKMAEDSLRDGARRGVKKVGIVVTDGRSDDPDATWERARVLRNDEDAFMVAVGIGNNIRQLELEGIASASLDNNVIKTEDFDRLDEIQEQLVDAICNNVNECDDRPCENRGTCVDLIGGYRCECTDEWTGRNCQIRDSGIVDISFVFDSSGSIRRERFDAVTEAFASYIEDNLEIRPGKTKVAAVQWSNEAAVEFGLDQYQSAQDVAHAIRRMSYMKERTHTADALRLMSEEVFNERNGNREEARDVAFIITDGNSNINPDETIARAIEAHIQGIQTIVLAVGEDLNMMELNGMASRPVDQNLFVVESFEDIPDIIGDVINAHYNLEDNCRRDPCQNRAECVDEVGFYSCLCRSDFSGMNCDRRCRRQMDVALLLDLSGSIDVAYDIVTRFAEELVVGLPVRFDRANVALISYQDTAVVNFNLDVYETQRELLAALSFPGYGGKTNAADALRLSYREVFNGRGGDRDGVDNIVVMITDGRSTEQASNTRREAEQAKNRDIEIYVVAVGPEPNMSEINDMASDPDSDHVVEARRPEDVETAASDLLDRLCEDL